MSNAAIAALGFIVIVGCQPELDSIKPAQRVKTYLVVPGHNHRFVVSAEIVVPTGYVRDLDPGGTDTFERRARDPDIRITSGLSIDDPAADEPDPHRFTRCTTEGAGERVVQRLPRIAGGVVVCESRDMYSDRVRWKFITRDYRWHDYDFQCEVSFHELNHPDGPYDEGNPSASRIRDAIAICDSFEVREMTQTELERFFPVPAERLRDVPPAERSQLYPSTR